MRYLLPILILTHMAAFALDKDQEEGLKQTKEMLRDPSKRQDAIKGDPKATEMDQKVDALAGGSGTKGDMYELAAQLMDKIAAETNGDPQKMQALILEAQKNPEAFYKKYFSAEQKAKVRGIATKIKADQPGIAGGK